MNIFEMIEMAKKSEYGCVWYSEKGPIQIMKDGSLVPISNGDLSTYQPERSKREDSCEHVWFKTRTTPIKCMRCGALNSMET